METINLTIQWGGIVVVSFMVLLALPQSRLREIVLPFVGWAVAALSAVYVISPIDIVPDFFLGIGWVDDLAAIAVGIASAMAAINATKGQKQLD